MPRRPKWPVHRAAFDELTKRGWTVSSRRAFPDQLCHKLGPDGRTRYFGLYITTRKALRPEQWECGLILTLAGLPCYMTGIDNQLFPISPDTETRSKPVSLGGTIGGVVVDA